MLTGSVLLAGGGRWVVFLTLNLVVLEVKVVFEERLLMGAFPVEYRQYRSRVPRLIPGLKLLALRPVEVDTEASAVKVPRVLT